MLLVPCLTLMRSLAYWSCSSGIRLEVRLALGLTMVRRGTAHDMCQTKLDFGQGPKGSCMVAEGKKFHCKVCCVSFDRKQALAAHEVCDRRHLALVGASSTLAGGFSTYVTYNSRVSSSSRLLLPPWPFLATRAIVDPHLVAIAVATLDVAC